VADDLTRALSNPGPHTAESLVERLPGFPLEAVREALETLAAQGVLARHDQPDGTTAYEYVAPDRYVQVNLDVIQDPAKGRPVNLP
jgi:Fe2+ or Zn2+ uptake regulation protein